MCVRVFVCVCVCVCEGGGGDVCVCVWGGVVIMIDFIMQSFVPFIGNRVA